MQATAFFFLCVFAVWHGMHAERVKEKRNETYMLYFGLRNEYSDVAINKI